MSQTKQKINGFTIVELLIVIVVIAILAAISIVAYNGIQQRAHNSQIIAGVNSYIKSIRLLNTDTGAYSAANGCLGAGYESNQCWSGINGNYYVSSALDTALEPYMSVKPLMDTKKLQITTAPDYRSGILYRYFGQSDVRLIYYLEGPGNKCINGVVGGNEMEGTQCILQLAS